MERCERSQDDSEYEAGRRGRDVTTPFLGRIVSAWATVEITRTPSRRVSLSLKRGRKREQATVAPEAAKLLADALDGMVDWDDVQKLVRHLRGAADVDVAPRRTGERR
jgi:hypothetical protein